MPDIRSSLETARRDLLDLGLRNPLLNYRLLRTKGVEIVEESPAEVFRILVGDEKRMTFLPAEAARNEGGQDEEVGQPEADSSRLTDLQLQTAHTSAQLQSRLLATYYAARTGMEEQGVNTLYLALAMLRWSEKDEGEKTYRAPLILVPVELERSDARDRFHLKYTGEEIGCNISLAEKLKVEFGFKSFPDLPEADEIEVGEYFDQVARLVRRQAGWAVESDVIALGFFSFAKFLMFRDLDPDTWADSTALLGHDVLQRLMGDDGFEARQNKYTDDRLLDDQLGDHPPVQVVDADSTQTIAILDALDGQNMVIQGPPGTGKSQTIVNLIAAAVADGKRVLFVSEKMAALEVVKRRLDAIGLNGPCLELHSNRSNKKAVLDELKRTVLRSANSGSGSTTATERLSRIRDRLNRYCAAVNQPIGGSGETPCSAYGRLLDASLALRELDLPTLNLEAGQWSSTETAARRELVEKLQQRLTRTGVPRKHPFWSSRLGVLLPTDRDEVGRRTNAGLLKLRKVEEVSGTLACLLNVEPPRTTPDAVAVVESAEFGASAPDLGDIDASAPEWLARDEQIANVLDAGKRYSAIKREYSGVLKPDAWERDLAELRRESADLGSRWWRFLSKRWRELRQEIATLCSGLSPRDQAGRLRLLDAIIDASRFQAAINEADLQMSALFRSSWRKTSSDWELLEQQAAWILDGQRRVRSKTLTGWCLEPKIRSLDRSAVSGMAGRTMQTIAELEGAIASWIEVLKLERPQGAPDPKTEPWETMRHCWTSQLAALDQLQTLVAFNQIAAECEKNGLRSVVEVAEEWEIGATHLVPLFERSRLSSLLQRAFKERPALASFDGGDHSRMVEEFRRLDRLQLEYTRAQIANRHAQSIPPGGGSGELGVLWREFEKKRKHLPIRKLMEGAGHVIQTIKPVFMMSPLSIANYLPPACLEFDLVIFDEASQVKPVDALGAVVRGKQIVVVGDSKQLPPTSFFDYLTNGDEEEEDEAATSDIESILGLFSARGAHQRMLQWHYRSRHESLISASNHLFYDDRLVVFPSPARERKSLGLIYRHLDNAWYDRSRTRTNPEEAKAVAAEVMRHAREQLRLPKEHRETLGVASFSAAQMDAILSQVELLRRQDPACEEFFGYPPHEPFFVKNLENVQGDERDVIFISVGYARTREGFLAMNFGPLNRPGGERRLNVLISRARRRCEVFTSLAADDIDVMRAPSAGVTALKTFLQYAQTGRIETAAPSARPPDSDFEDQVKRELERLGCTVQSQVGCAGFFIDLAVVDQARPVRYLLGVECDGATYHSARSARDRDRLRQSVLEGLGWQIHRIWSTDWFHNPEAELRRLMQAIQTAQDVPPSQSVPPATPPIVPTAPSNDTPPATGDLPTVPPLSGAPYELASIRLRLGNVAMHEVDRNQLADLLTGVVDVESPVHWREAARRIIQSAGVQKLGSRIEAAFNGAVETGVARRRFTRRGEFLWKVGMSEPPVRDRSALSNGSRKLELVAPEEIRQAILKAVGESYGMTSEDIPSAVCRVLGFVRVTDEMKTDIRPQVDALIQNGALKARGQNLTISQATSA